ncbi:MAG: tripartite tricarboxylate transporter substrate binding protein, partial [Burkholderiaceae bacterium]|nr:tripartite tricarboxylate transporter substrate binding protein [Burkholderiaceae bacterium]
MKKAFLGGLLALATALGAPAGALAQDYPSKTIKIISPSAPGGPTDVSARIIADRLAQVLKVPVIVENKPGGTGALAFDLIAKSPPDGYTLTVGFVAGMVFHPILNNKLPFDAQKDFTPVTQITFSGNMLVVHPSVPATNVKEFVAYVKAQPRPPSYGSWGNASGGHLAGEFIKTLTGIDMLHVPYRSTSALAIDMAGGHMLLGVLDTTNTMAQAKAGRLRPLAVTGPSRSKGLPEVPTMIEQGVNFSAGIWTGIFGPANMPKPIVDKLNLEIGKILREPETREKFLSATG